MLGGTTEASRLAQALAKAGADAIFSYAGVTKSPMAQPLPTRAGGFGGVDGLVAYLTAEGITHVVDATHPFAAGMSTNAVAACAQTGVDLAALERPAWQPEAGDSWTHVPDMAAAVRALPADPMRIFLAIGKKNIADFAVQPQHHYLLRLVDAPEGVLPLPNYDAVVARGPFEVAQDQALMTAHNIDLIVAKNGGGKGARAKLDAARALGLPVILIDRPKVPARQVLPTVADVMAWLDHGAERGV